MIATRIPARRCAHLFHGENIWFAEGWQAALEATGIKQASEWRRLSPGTFVSGGSPVTNCYRIELNNGEVVYFKRYVYDLPRIQFWMMPSKPAIEVFGYDFMRQHGMHVPEVVAYGERRQHGTLVAAFIVTKEIPDTVNLGEFARDTWFHMAEPERSKIYNQIADRVCRQTRSIHAAGFFHHDLKWKNILLRKDDNGWQPVWIDCPRAARISLRKRRSVVIELGRLGRLASRYLSVKQQLRWLHNYLGEAAGKQEVKKLYREVQAYLDRRRPPHDYELPGK